MSDVCPVCQAPVNPQDVSCPQCGFRLLGATQKFEPLSIDGAERTAVRGPQAGVVYELTGDDLTIGRSPQCSIFLNDMTVSRMHARLHREGSCFVISDENSFNGVWVNNSNVETKALSSGDFIQIGAFCLVYEESAS